MITLYVLALLCAAGYATYLGIQNARLERSISDYHLSLALRGWTPEYTHQHWLKCMGRA